MRQELPFLVSDSLRMSSEQHLLLFQPHCMRQELPLGSCACCWLQAQVLVEWICGGLAGQHADLWPKPLVHACRTRQAAITTELTEIISGAAALEG